MSTIDTFPGKFGTNGKAANFEREITKSKASNYKQLIVNPDPLAETEYINGYFPGETERKMKDRIIKEYGEKAAYRCGHTDGKFPLD